MKLTYKKAIIPLFLVIASLSFGQNICEIATPVCSNENFSGNPPTGNPGGTIDGGCQNLEAEDVTWYFIRIQSGTTFTFEIVPDDDFDDYDFAVWKNPDCDNLGEADRASYSIPYTGVTGLMLNETDTCEGAGGGGTVDEMVRHLDVVPGDEILIAVDKFSDAADGFTLVFGNGGAGEGDAQLDCTITGEPYGVCDLDFNNEEYFDLDIIADDLTDGEPTWTVDFYEVETDAQAGNSNTESSPYLAYEVNNPTSLFARIEDNGVFENIVEVFLFVNPKPELLIFEIDLSLCDSNEDGEEIFDLTQTEPDFVATPTDYNFHYYTDINDAHNGNSNFINPADAYSSGSDDIYVRIDPVLTEEGVENCYSLGTIHLNLEDQIVPEFNIGNSYCVNMSAPTLPNISDDGIQGTWSPSSIDTSTEGQTIYTFTPNLGQCAQTYELTVDVTEGVAPEFTIDNQYCLNSDAEDLPLTSNNGVQGTWSPSTIDTSIPGTSNYTFIPDDASCVSDLEISIEILELPTLSPTSSIELCDDNFDGNYNYDLNDLQNLISSDPNYSLNYYASQTDLDNNNPISTTQLSNYEFTGGLHSILVVAENEEECRSNPLEVQFIEGEKVSTLGGPYEIPFCDGEGVDLTQYESTFSSEAQNYAYYGTLSNAQNDVSPITNYNNYIPASIGTLIYVRLESTDKCPEIITVEFIAGEEVANTGTHFDTIEFCADDNIDLTQYEADLSPDFNYIDFSYYQTELNAQDNTNPITNPDSYIFSNDSGSLYVKLEQNGKCPVIIELPYERRTSPTVQVSNNETLCDGEEIEITATSDNPDDIIQWIDEDGNVLEGETQTFTETGTYSVIAIGGNGCESTPQTVTIAPPSPPTITHIESGNGYIIVNAANNGGGPMEYSLDGILWQSSNQFNNLVNGQTYTVYVRSDGCVKTSYVITILDVPNFVSPNGDGYNDEWTIRGIDVTPDATIKIFDRFGKVFVDTNFDGNYVWDGKYNGNPLPSGDYWYILNVPGDGIIVPQKYIGHVSIRN